MELSKITRTKNKETPHLYQIKGSIFHTLTDLQTSTHVLVYNKIRERELTRYLNKLGEEKLNKITFITKKELELINNYSFDLLLIDEYELFRLEEIWFEVLALSNNFRNTIAFSDLEKNKTCKIKQEITLFEDVFVANVLFNIKLKSIKVIIICNDNINQCRWIKLFQQENIQSKIYKDIEVEMDACMIDTHQCHIFSEFTSIKITTKEKILFVSDIKISKKWLDIFFLYNDRYALSVMTLEKLQEKSHRWKYSFVKSITETYIKGIMYRIWEFFYV